MKKRPYHNKPELYIEPFKKLCKQIFNVDAKIIHCALSKRYTVDINGYKTEYSNESFAILVDTLYNKVKHHKNVSYTTSQGLVGKNLVNPF